MGRRNVRFLRLICKWRAGMGDNNGLIGYGAFFCDIPVRFLQIEDFSVTCEGLEIVPF